MLVNPTAQKLKGMRLPVMAAMTENPEPGASGMDFDERLGLMVDSEWEHRENARVARLLRGAALKAPACVEDISYGEHRRLDRRLVGKLATCAFVDQGINVILTGRTGTGKTWLACALGNSACRHGITVRYHRMPELLLDLEDARIHNNYSARLRQLQSVRLLILDDWGMGSYKQAETYDIMEIVDRRYKKGSIIFVSQIPCDKWYELFSDPTQAESVLDRFIHNSHVLALDSDISMRAIAGREMMRDAMA